MKIHAYILCHNEEDILDSVLQHYLTFCSMVFVVNNDSTDKSIEIAKRYNKVKIINFSTEDGFDDLKNKWAKESFYKQYSKRDGLCFIGEEADYIITVDADELIFSKDIVGTLSSYKEQGITVPKVVGYQMVSDSYNVGDDLIRNVSNGVRDENFDKPVIFSCDFEQHFSPGCHPKGKGFNEMKAQENFRTSSTACLFLLHFKHIGKRSFIKNNENLERLSERNVERGHGRHYFNYKDAGKAQNKIDKLLSVSEKVLNGNGDLLTPELNENSWSLKAGLSKKDKTKELDEKEVNSLRDAALAAEKLGDVVLASELMGTALSYRPQGPLINKKVKLYENSLKNKKLSSHLLRTEKLVFIITYQRSGSTLLQNILNSHRGVDLKGENGNAFFGLWKTYTGLCHARKNTLRGDVTEKDWPFYGAENLKPEAFWSQSSLRLLREVLCLKDLEPVMSCRGFKEVKYIEFGDELIAFLKKINETFENVKFLFNFRNIEDVTNSAWNKKKDKERLTKQLQSFEKQALRFVEESKNSMVVRYDDYVRTPENLLDVFAFLEVEPDSRTIRACLDKKLVHGKKKYYS